MAQTVEKALGQHDANEDAAPRGLPPTGAPPASVVPAIAIEQADAAGRAMQALLIKSTALWTQHRHDAVPQSGNAEWLLQPQVSERRDATLLRWAATCGTLTRKRNCSRIRYGS